MFKALGALLALYTIYAVTTGNVYAKSGPGGRSISKTESPADFWITIAIYAGLSAALLFVF